MSLLDNIKDDYEKFKLDSLIQIGLEYSKKCSNSWTLATFFEWAYLFSDNNALKLDANETDMHRICNNIFQLMDEHPLADFNIHNPRKFFRVLAYQQFSFQENQILLNLSHQYFLFNAENEGTLFQKKFKQSSGLSVKQFVKLLYKCWTWINAKGFDSMLPASHQTHLLKELNHFMNILTLKHENGKTELDAYIRNRNIKTVELQSFIPNFFVMKPFIEFNRKVSLLHINLFQRTIKEFLFRFLKTLQESTIKRNFDNRFENYIELGLKEIGLDYKRDDVLKNKLNSEKECDYFIDNFLYVECKAIEIKQFAQINPKDEILLNNLEDVIKAYQQIIATAHRHNQNEEKFGVIVTFFPFYFSDGTDIWNEFLKESIETFLKKHSYNLLIPPENLFFIDLVSWDLLINVLKEKKITIKQIFSLAKENNSKDKDADKKFEFKMHLEPFLNDKINLLYVNEFFKNIFQYK